MILIAATSPAADVPLRQRGLTRQPARAGSSLRLSP
jgi:hypothetical protein